MHYQSPFITDSYMTDTHTTIRLLKQLTAAIPSKLETTQPHYKVINNNKKQHDGCNFIEKTRMKKSPTSITRI